MRQRSMLIIAAMAIVVLACCGSAQALHMPHYQWTTDDGTWATAADWSLGDEYDPWDDPNSPQVTGPPTSDYAAFIRNGGVCTVASGTTANVGGYGGHGLYVGGFLWLDGGEPDPNVGPAWADWKTEGGTLVVMDDATLNVAIAAGGMLRAGDKVSSTVVQNVGSQVIYGDHVSIAGGNQFPEEYTNTTTYTITNGTLKQFDTEVEDTDISIGGNAGCDGTLTINGSSSYVRTRQDISMGVGAGGSGTINMNDGLVECARPYVGKEDGYGELNVNGGSIALQAGVFNKNTFRIAEGTNGGNAVGVVNVDGGYIGSSSHDWFVGNADAATSEGTVNVISGTAEAKNFYLSQQAKNGGTTDSRMNLIGGVVLGNIGVSATSGKVQGESTLDIALANTATVTGNVTFGALGALEVDLASLASFSSAAVSGAITLDGGLVVNLVGGYAPDVGDKWNVMTGVSGVSGTFTIAGSTPYFIGYGDGAGNMVVEYVPEPMTMSLLALGGLALIRRKR